MSDENKMNDLWSSMAQEAESLDQSAKVNIPRQPITRRVSLREKLAAAYLSGFLPALLALWTGCLVATANCAMISPKNIDLAGGLLVVGLVLALPLAWLTANLWTVGRATSLRYLLLAFLAGGVGQIAMVLPYYAAAALLPREVSLARIVQKLFESYLSFDATLVSVVAALALIALSAKMRRSVPWVELAKPASLIRLGVATLIALSPILFLVLCAVGQGRIAPRAAWAQQAIFKETKRSWARAKDGEWIKLVKQLEAEDPAYFQTYDNSLPSWSKTAHQQAEARAQELMVLPLREEGYYQQTVVRALLRRSHDLKNPLGFAWAALEARLGDTDRGWSSDATNALVGVILPTLCQRPLSQAELSLQLQKLEAVQAQLKDPQQELEEKLIEAARWHLRTDRDDLPQPLMAFGMEVPYSPERLVAEFRIRQVFYPWMEIKKGLKWTSQRRLELSLDAELAKHPSVSLRNGRDALEQAARSAARDGYSLNLRPYFQSARTIIALRRHKLENGVYPKTLAELGPQTTLDPSRTSYSVKDGHALLGREHEGHWESKEVPSWTLP